MKNKSIKNNWFQHEISWAVLLIPTLQK